MSKAPIIDDSQFPQNANMFANDELSRSNVGSGPHTLYGLVRSSGLDLRNQDLLPLPSYSDAVKFEVGVGSFTQHLRG